MTYDEDDWLQLSGLQHFKFCRRRWALIHIEQQWAENYRTTDGELMHANAHDRSFTESRGDVFVTRGMNVHSASLGVSGECDVLEFHRCAQGVPLQGKDGLWRPYPVEYKRGTYNGQSGDTLQLCCQAMCLEEMLCCDVPEGAMYYGETRRRMAVPFTAELRDEVKSSLAEMHELFRRACTPRVKPTRSCGACSLKELCLPELMRAASAKKYLEDALEGDG